MKPGDTVYYMHHNKVAEGVIKETHIINVITITGNTKTVNYTLEGGPSFLEDEVFKSKKDLLSSL